MRQKANKTIPEKIDAEDAKKSFQNDYDKLQNQIKGKPEEKQLYEIGCYKDGEFFRTIDEGIAQNDKDAEKWWNHISYRIFELLLVELGLNSVRIELSVSIQYRKRYQM